MVGYIAGATGQPEVWLHYSNDALTVATEAGDLEGQAMAHGHIGVAHHLLGDETGSLAEYRDANTHYEQARAINSRLGLHEAMTTANIAQIHVRLGNDAEAKRHIHEALSSARSAARMPTLLFSLLVEADRRLANGDEARALDLINAVWRHEAATMDKEAEIHRILRRAGLSTNRLEQHFAANLSQTAEALADMLERELDPG